MSTYGHSFTIIRLEIQPLNAPQSLHYATFLTLPNLLEPESLDFSELLARKDVVAFPIVMLPSLMKIFIIFIYFASGATPDSAWNQTLGSNMQSIILSCLVVPVAPTQSFRLKNADLATLLWST